VPPKGNVVLVAMKVVPGRLVGLGLVSVSHSQTLVGIVCVTSVKVAVISVALAVDDVTLQVQIFSTCGGRCARCTLMPQWTQSLASYIQGVI
jgi:hypothetical protein